MPTVARNPQTGETLLLVGNQWAPVAAQAQNPQTGELLGLVGNEWLPLNAEAAKEDAGFWGSLMEGAQTLGLTDEAAAFAANPNAQTRQALIKAGESKYRHVGFGEGRNWEAFKQLLGGSIGQMLAPIGAGLVAGGETAATIVGAPAAPFVGIGAAGLAGTTQYANQNLLRQAQEQQAAIEAGKAPEETSAGKAIAAAAAQAGLDLAGGKIFGGIAKAFPFMRPLVGKAGEKAAEKAGSVLADAAEKGTITFAGGVARGVGKGVAFEVPQEVAQQALERWQAGLAVNPFEDKDARDEYTQAAVGALLLGGSLGAVAGAVRSRGRAAPAAEEEKLLTPETTDDRTRLADYFEQRYSLDREDAEAQADFILEKEKERATAEPDIGRGEPDISGVGAADVSGGVAPAPAAVESGPVGGAGVSPVEPEAVTAEQQPPLTPESFADRYIAGEFNQPGAVTPEVLQFLTNNGPAIEEALARRKEVASEAAAAPTEPAPVIPPIETVSPQAQIAEQLAPVEEAAPVLYHGGRSGMTLDDINIVREPGATKQGKKGRVYGGFYATTNPEEAQGYADMAGEGNTVYAVQLRPDAVVEQKEGDITRLTPQQIDAYRARGVDVVVGKDVRGRTEHAIINKDAVVGLQDTQAAPVAAAPEVAVTEPTPVAAEEVAPAEPMFAPEPTKVELPEELQGLQGFVDEYRPGFEVRYNPETKKPYSYGIPGQKNLGRSTTIEGLRRQILNEAPLKPTETVEGVPVKKMPPGEAKGIKKVEKDFLSPEEIDPVIRAGKLNVAQQEQVDLLMNEIDTARKMREITDGERTQLVDMLRTPTGKDLMRSPTWRVASNLQEQIDQLTKRGRELAKDQKKIEGALGTSLFEKGAKLTPEAKRLKTEITGVSKATKDLGEKLLGQKKSIYDAARKRLNDMRQERGGEIEAVRERRAQAKRNVEKGFIDEATYKKVMRETEHDLRRLRPEPVRFRKGRAGSAGISLETLNAAAKDAVSGWRVPIEPKMVQSFEDLPAAVRKELEDADRTDAFGFVKGNTVYLIADNMHSVDDVAPTLFHEALGHLGLRSLFREQLDDVLMDVYNSNKKIKDATDAWMKDNAGAYDSDPEPLARAVEEVMAEASEGGPLSASTFDRIVRFIRDFARKVLGMNLKFTDSEINTILAMAHERVVDGYDLGSGSASALFSKPKTTPKVKEKLSQYDDEVTDGLKKTQVEISAQEMGGAIDALLKANDINEFNEALNDNMRSIGDSMLDKMLKFFPASGIASLGEEAGVRGLTDIIDLEAKMRGMQENIVESSAAIEKRLQKLNAQYGQEAIGTLARLARRHRIDPYAYADITEALAKDPTIRRWTAAQNDPNVSVASKRWKPKQIELRQKKLREVYAARAKLDAQEGGKQLYLDSRQYFKDMHGIVRRLLEQRVKGLKLDDKSKQNLLNALQLEEDFSPEERKRPTTEKELEDDLYWDVPEKDLHTEYFPFMRHGEAWLRISSKASPLGRELYFFDTTTERNQFMRKRAKELGIDVNDGEAIKIGNKLDDGRLRQDLLTTDAVFNKIFDIVNKATMEGGYDTTQYKSAEEALGALKKKLGDDIYQTYLLTLPERSVQKSFIHANLVPGASADFIRTFNTKARSFSNQISKLSYIRKIELALDDARKSIDSLPPLEQARAGVFIDNMAEHVKQVVEPPMQNKFTNFVNRGAFIWFLSSAATAFTQTSAIPIRVLPHLGARYGYTKTTGKFGKYMKVWDTLGTRHEEPDGSVNFSLPNVGDSAFLRGNKLAQRAYREGHKRRVFESTSVNALKGEATPKTGSQKLIGRITESVYNGLTGLFNMSEKITREAAYMMTFELEHERLMAERKPTTKAELDAIFDEAVVVAAKTTNDTLGNYTDLERPLAMKGNLGRLVFLFKQYAVNTTKFFVGNLRRMFTKPGERWEAFKELSGVLLMGGLFHGLAGMPLYGVFTWALDLLMDPDDDDPETKLLRAKENPYLADNSDARFRYQWMPSVFGQVKIPGIDGKQHSLSDTLMNGPISELSDINIGSRTTFDGLWFRSGTPGDTPYQTAVNTVLENIAGLSWGKSFADAIGLWQKGEITRGFEKILPAAVRGGATAYRLGTEGAETLKGDKMLRADDMTDLNLVASTLGFQPTKLAEIQKKRALITSTNTRIKNERNELFSQLNKARMDPEGSPTRIMDVLEKIVKFNRRYPYPGIEITVDSINQSFRGAQSQRKYEYQGLTPTMKELPYALPIMLAGQ